ncbi:MAG TPA: hypothetical protein VH187_13585 [Scandinavium sp.]|jgi:hypothetical protein|uniref:hypothetical protein n=1 Tax=Scandinavium sp. TaxID=2830653 RepID=UPI002E327538|nr:hypothetical protein [Scandinavium sp.]HEX4502163.1 hypothetical protein [Scandinavium sp.]
MSDMLACAGCGEQHGTCEIHPMEPGDYVVCPNCGQINMLGDDRQMHTPSESEIIMLIMDEEFAQYIHAMAQEIRRHRKAGLN